ncbi:TNR14 factor, partial [Calyptomena viridis]|nr:TNR14 factor [Calyptomena viridis]
AGLRVFKHCTASSSTTCIPCVKGTYTAHPNGLTHCMPCRHCDEGANLMTAAACTYTKNTVCGCQPEHFCTSLGPEGCELCQPYTVCGPGTVLKQRGKPTTKDNVCQVCPPGTSSTGSMSETCTQQPRSRHHNYFFSHIRLEEPSPALPVPAVIAVLVSVVILAVVPAVIYVWQRRKRKSYMPRKYRHEQRGQALVSSEEKGDQTTVPVQEVGAHPEETRTE